MSHIFFFLPYIYSRILKIIHNVAGTLVYILIFYKLSVYFYSSVPAWNENMYAWPGPFLVLLTQQVLTRLPPLSSISNFLPRMASFRGPKRWKSEGSKLGLQGGCGNTVHPFVWWLPESWHMWGLVFLRWSNISRSFLSGQTCWKCFLIFFCVLIYASELSFLSLSHQWESLLQSKNTVTLMFLAHGEHQGAAPFILLCPLTLFALQPTVLLSTAAFP
jgi:hypothetical protein